MVGYIVRRLVYAVPTLLLVVVAVFFLIYLVPGDPAAVMLGPDATPEEIAAVRHRLALDRPLFYQLGKYMLNLARGDLGTSYYYKLPVLTLFLERLPNTLQLAIVAMVFAILLAIPLGVTAAVKRHSIWDFCSMVLALGGISIPVFWLAIMLIYVFGVRLHWLPISGMGSSFFSIDGLRHVILPACALGTVLLASSTRLLRASMLEILNEDFVRTARAKGLRENFVIYKHALRNALNPLVTNIGLQLGALMGGAVLTETVFAWPGVGRLLVQGIGRRDYPLIQGLTLGIAFFIVFANLLADLSYAVVDPKIRYD